MNVLYRWCSKLILAVVLFTALPQFASAQVDPFLTFAENQMTDWEYILDAGGQATPPEPTSITDFESYYGGRPRALEVGNVQGQIQYELGQVGSTLDIIESIESPTAAQQVRINNLRSRGAAIDLRLGGVASTLGDFIAYLDALDIIWDAWQGQSVEVQGLKAEAGESTNAAMSIASDFTLMISGTEGCQRAGRILTWYYNEDGNNAIGLMYAYQTIANGNRDDAAQAIFNSGSLVWMIDATLGSAFFDEWENWLYAIDNDINFVVGSFQWACYYYQSYC